MRLRPCGGTLWPGLGIGENVKRLREEKNSTQPEPAKAVGPSQGGSFKRGRSLTRPTAKAVIDPLRLGFIGA